ncbi:MAG: hypothetical protein HY088_03570 [Ignavibacteriales bacterium]|nr:hypothetical protein [Ignavibacteriales bacterium]
MQKLDFTLNIQVIKEGLRSSEFVEKFDKALLQNIDPYNGTVLTAILVQSKSNYDQLVQKEHLRKIFEQLGALPIYETGNFSQILDIALSKKSSYQILYNKPFGDFYSMQSAILRIAKLAENLFFEESTQGVTENIDLGYLVFQVSVNEGGLSIVDYGKIFEKLRELIEAISKALDPTRTLEEPKLLLLDSGSNTNLGIKTTAEVAHSLAIIFKEIWDWIINKEHYKNKLFNDSLMSNLEVMKVIKQHEKEGTLNADEAKTLVHTIKTRTNDLLELNVLPKKIADENYQVKPSDLLLEYKEIKKLNPKSGE